MTWRSAVAIAFVFLGAVSVHGQRIEISSMVRARPAKAPAE